MSSQILKRSDLAQDFIHNDKTFLEKYAIIIFILIIFIPLIIFSTIGVSTEVTTKGKVKKTFPPIPIISEEPGVFIRYLSSDGKTTKKGDPVLVMKLDRTDSLISLSATMDGILKLNRLSNNMYVNKGLVIGYVINPKNRSYVSLFVDDETKKLLKVDDILQIRFSDTFTNSKREISSRIIYISSLRTDRGYEIRSELSVDGLSDWNLQTLNGTNCEAVLKERNTKLINLMLTKQN